MANNDLNCFCQLLIFSPGPSIVKNMNGKPITDNETQAWEHAETHGNGTVIKRLAGDSPHGCMAGVNIIENRFSSGWSIKDRGSVLYHRFNDKRRFSGYNSGMS